MRRALDARQFRAARPTPLIHLPGITPLDTMEVLLRMPDGTAGASLCVHCSNCMPTIYPGSRCVLTPPPLRPE